MNAFLAALRFLTVLPLPSPAEEDGEALGRSARWFPAVGLVLGVAAAVLAAGFMRVLPNAPAAVLLTAALAFVSGGLHLDGLADTADGFMSSRPRERMLEIMRDSRVGSMGVVVLVLTLALKIACFVSLEPQAFWRAALLAPLAGRCALVFQMNLLPYARAEGGLGTIFFDRRRCTDAWIALAVLAVGGGIVAGWAGLAAAAATGGLALAFARLCRSKIGGATGDTLGASCELSEVVPPLLLAAFSG